MHAPQILLVDDDPTLLQALPHMLTLHLHRIQVETARSAIEALQRMQVQDYETIISDITMPGMDGLELLAHIREIQPETPTILITGQVDPRFLIQAMEQGAYDFLQKPLDRFSLVVALHRAIQTRQLRRQVQEQQHLLISSVHLLEHLEEHQQDSTQSRGSSGASAKRSSPFQPPAWLL
jgi:two-component system C4-dicarboxylate transport response regulator DctD